MSCSALAAVLAPTDGDDLLATRATVEQAKGILMAQRGCRADDALAVLERASQAAGLDLAVVAGQIVASVVDDCG